MNRPDNDALATLLRDTLVAHERLADPDRATAIAVGVLAERRRPSRLPLVAAAAAVVLAVVGTSVALGRLDDGAPAAGPTPPTGSSAPRTPLASSGADDPGVASHRAAAAAESERVLDLTPLPDGAEMLPGPPPGWPEGVRVSLDPSDGDLSRTRWWSIPGDVAALEAFLTSVVLPAGLVREPGERVSSSSGDVSRLALDRPSSDPEAFTGTGLLLQWKTLPTGTFLQATTFLAARGVRSADSRVDSTVTSVTVRRTHTPFGGVPFARTYEIDDAAAADRLVAAIDGLEASIEPAPVGLCPFGPTGEDAVTITTTSGTWRFAVADGCYPQVEVSRDGVDLPGTLDPADLTLALEEAVAAGTPITGSVHGTVVVAGGPAPGVRHSTGTLVFTGPVTRRAAVADDGTFAAELPPGRYEVTVVPDGLDPSFCPTTNVVVSAGERVTASPSCSIR